MKIHSIKINNFRSIREIEINPNAICTLIGKNSTGKSNLLKAIAFFFKASTSSADPADRCDFGDDSETWVECTFKDLTENEKSELEKYLLSDDTVCFRRTLVVDGESAKTTVRGYVEEATNEWLNANFENYADNDYWKDLGINVFDYATPSKSGKITKAAFSEFCKEYQRQNPAGVTLERKLSETEAKGRQSTLSSILPNLIFIPAVGDIASEIYGKKTSLLNSIVSRSIKAAETDARYISATKKLAEAQGFVNPSPHRLDAVKTIEEELESRLSSWPGVKCSIRTDVGSLTDLLVSGLRLHIDDGLDSELATKGDGIQRQVLFQAFRLYAEHRSRTGIFADTETADIEAPASIIIFEEPELFLHPQAQEQFFDDLVAVSERDQVFLATHSNHLIRLEYADSLYIARRSGLRDPTTLSGPTERWTTPDDIRKIKEIDEFNSEVAKMLFADRIVLTEGPEDVIYLLATARQCGVFKRSVAVVSAGGIDSIPNLQRVLNALKTPYCVAHDSDPGNNNTAATAAKIAALATEGQDTGCVCEVYAFTDTLPHEYFGGQLPDGGSKVAKALSFVSEQDADPAFVTRVRRLYGDQ